MRTVLIRLAGAVGFVGLWWLATRLRVADPVLVPSPAETWRGTAAAFSRGPLLHDLARTI